ncbi:hypothetical protein AVEN_24412-1 [Araneus ventricosus]|uniref:Endonuclease/exonuclease/phosphatase domain-containing protein n=1 Tax=Araneus ventricosus TaxID=182803 RepID=A0A4Y2WMX9_ARAVE|nr:hypothetical protein AVEN_24412-1 [Araneus ventricosus]
MRHELWGPEIHKHRISGQAAPLVSFILKYDLIIWNDKDSEPTFETINDKSWIDITMSSANLANKKMNWQVIKNNFSDHNYLVFNVESFSATRDPPRIFFNHRQILKICKAVHQIFLELQEEIQTIDSKQKLEKWIEELTNTINQISQSFPRKVIKHLRVPWWDFELEDEEVWNFDNQRGVPQGSCSGPLFWNLVMDTALDLPLPQGSHIQAYADDIIVVIREQLGCQIFATVYQAEVTGIQMALEFISTIGPWNKINLYTDFLSILEAIYTFKTSKQEILAIRNDILEMSKEISIALHWIPAHTGWLVVWGLMAQEPFLAKLRQTYGR